VGSVSSGSPTLADDIALLATTHLYLQRMLAIAQAYADTWNLQFNADKCRTLVFRNGPNMHATHAWVVVTTPVPHSSTYKHVGLVLSANLKHSACVSIGCSKGRGAFYSLVGYGVKSDVSLYHKIVVPTAMYGCELWSNMTNADNRRHHSNSDCFYTSQRAAWKISIHAKSVTFSK
jgi:hypothetical protein